MAEHQRETNRMLLQKIELFKHPVSLQLVLNLDRIQTHGLPLRTPILTQS